MESAINTHPNVSIPGSIENPNDEDEENVAFEKILPGDPIENSELTDYLRDQLTDY